MSDFDRNLATARSGYRTDQVAIDAGLRAYMIRVYNYMASGVALTGVVSWLTYQAAGGSAIQVARRPDQRAHAVRPGDLQRPMTIVLFLGTLGLVFFMSFRINRLQASTALGLFMFYAGAARPDAVIGVSGLYRRVDHPNLLHLGGIVRRVEPVRLHHAARSLADRLVPDHGPVRADYRDDRQVFLRSQGLDFAISAIGVLIFAGLTAWDTQRIKEMYSAMDDGTVAGRKAVMGALSLYLDFINLFLFLLRFMGDRR